MKNTEKNRTAIRGLVGGLMALAMVGLFAVGLPTWPTDAVHGDDAVPAALPERLPGGLIALDSGQLPLSITSQLTDEAQLGDALDATEGRIAALFDAPAAFQIYASADGQRLGLLTVVSDEPGLFLLDGPPVPQEHAAQATYDVVAVDGGVCAVYRTTPTGALAGGKSGAPGRVIRTHCQLALGGLTWDLDAQGLPCRRTLRRSRPQPRPTDNVIGVTISSAAEMR